MQSQRQSEFAERMYIHNSRIFNTYRRPVVSLGVLADEQSSWRPNCYEETRFQEGNRRQRQEDIARILEVCFEEVPVELRERINIIEDVEVLGMLLIQAVTAQSLEAFESI